LNYNCIICETHKIAIFANSRDWWARSGRPVARGQETRPRGATGQRLGRAAPATCHSQNHQQDKMDSDKADRTAKRNQEAERLVRDQERLLQQQQESREQELTMRERTLRARERELTQLAKRLKAKEKELEAKEEYQRLYQEHLDEQTQEAKQRGEHKQKHEPKQE